MEVFGKISLWDVFHRSLEKNKPKFKNEPDQGRGPPFLGPIDRFHCRKQIFKVLFFKPRVILGRKWG
jgi:hypothetical protein